LKSFGCVGNMVYQIERILEAPVEKVNGKKLWLCDHPPLRPMEWADEIQRAVGAHPISPAPLPLLRGAAGAGDAARMLGWQTVPSLDFASTI
jgi:hypothetical protein